MGINLVTFLIGVVLFQFNSAVPKKSDPLVSTKWRFIGYVYKNRNDSIEYSPSHIVYTLEFHKGNKLKGKVGLNIGGRYKLKGDNMLIIKPYILKGSDPNNPTQEEFNWRMMFSHAFGGKQPYLFSVDHDELKIVIEENVTMMFKRL
jgi:hypothetical protein